MIKRYDYPLNEKEKAERDTCDKEEGEERKQLLAEYEKKKKLSRYDRGGIVECDNYKIKQKDFIDTASQAGRITEAEYYQLCKQDCTNRLLQGIVLTLNNEDIGEYYIALD